jgi:hypothetical protein
VRSLMVAVRTPTQVLTRILIRLVNGVQRPCNVGFGALVHYTHQRYNRLVELIAYIGSCRGFVVVTGAPWALFELC